MKWQMKITQATTGLALGMVLAIPAVCRADVVLGHAGNASVGMDVVLTLNANGTIGANATSHGDNLTLFGVSLKHGNPNAADYDPRIYSYGFSNAAAIAAPIGSMWGYFPTGWTTYRNGMNSYLGGDNHAMSWTIGAPGTFASVAEALSPTTSPFGGTFDFYACVGGAWGCNEMGGRLTAAPEPPTIVLRPDRSPWINPIGTRFGFASSMDLSFEHNAFVFHMDIDYVGQGIDAHRLQNYETGIEKYWSDVRTVQIGGYDYPIEFDVNFLDANLLNHATADAQIEINNETCGGNNRSSVTRWCLNQPNEVVTDTQQMQLAAHEFGHLGLGLIDEYDDLLDPGFPLGSQVHLSDQFGNVCHYAGVLGFHLRTGAWCNDMMAVSGGSTKQARYFEQLEGYISGTMDRPGIQFGFAPLQPDIANLPVSTTPLLEDHSIPEPSTILMMFPALALLAWNRKIASRHESRLC